jgi:sulfur-oxidizing protein SoxX
MTMAKKSTYSALLRDDRKKAEVRRAISSMPLLIAGVLIFSISLVTAAEKKADKGQMVDGLVEFEIEDKIQSKSITKPLTGKAGDPKRGEAIMINRKLGNCLACHHLSVFDEKAKTDPNKYGDMGEVGPPLDGIAERYDEGQLRLLLVDAKQVYPDTIMPAFYKVEGLHRVLPEYEGKPILNAQEIEDVLSFLMTLK